MLNILITGGNGNIANIIKRHLHKKYNIMNPSRLELDLLNSVNILQFLENKQFDILIHTAISGGRRTTVDTSDVIYKNLLMFENIIQYADKFKMIINLDSGAIYNRDTDIMNRDEYDINTIPIDYYGLSKYIIYMRTLQYNNVYNFRIFNIFHNYEENDRFIKKCFFSKENNSIMNIYKDKYFDFVYEDDFITILEYYMTMCDISHVLEKTINICYDTKYKLSEIAGLIMDKYNINIINPVSNNNYCGNNKRLDSMNIQLLGLEKSIQLYSKL